MAVSRRDLNAIGLDDSPTTFAARVAEFRAPARELPGRWLRRYRALITSANTGAALRDPDE